MPAEPAGGPPPEELGRRMAQLAERAVAMAEQAFDISLDYSEASVEHVEFILGRLYDEMPRGRLAWLRGRPSPQQLGRMATIWGAYLGEVIRRRWGGHWAPTSPRLNQALPTLLLASGELYPPAKVYQRLTKGPEDNVSFYYQVLARLLADM
ncbi:MAG: hypothetical protein ACRDHL_00065 [Candidatus Promineifilaceae bacterium]